MTDATTGRLADALMHVAKRIRGCWMQQLAPLGLTPGQGRALGVVARAGDGIRMADLAGRLDIVPRSATSVVDGLEEQGLVLRRPDPGDRRSMLVSLTEAGRLLVSRIDEAKRGAAEEMFGTLDPAEREQLLAVLLRLDTSGKRARSI
ncbi:MarR family winged helix-turn-helix transcriptional regulator [Kutzneria sp. NPDC052558]|uniref:MarR family winged helix-turn-helix transcriptional regulator n=1 Tax=Kutzneria sp. NPDC052558 TaxID=3364121 RepID=UPI0037CCBE3B